MGEQFVNDRADQLVRDASTGDKVAIEDLLSRYLPELHAFVRLRAGARLLRREQSEDLVQSVCREVLQDMDGFEWRGEKAFKKWLYLTAQNKIVDRARYYGTKKRDVSREERMHTDVDYYRSGYAPLLSPSRVAIQKEEVEQLERAFAKLPEDYAKVITLARFLGLGHDEIAKELDRPVTATRMLLHRALARLGVLLSGLRGAG